jgi:hypothetical protein
LLDFEVAFFTPVAIANVAVINSMRIAIVEYSGVAGDSVDVEVGATVVDEEAAGDEGVGEGEVGAIWVTVARGADGFGEFNMGMNVILPRLKSFFWS